MKELKKYELNQFVVIADNSWINRDPLQIVSKILLVYVAIFLR